MHCCNAGYCELVYSDVTRTSQYIIFMYLSNRALVSIHLTDHRSNLSKLIKAVTCVIVCSATHTDTQSLIK